ncbi:hypothetical protein BJ165DRAFT_1597379 [Panaeolus papilionaceus]|nr:hypothetical protein BJ165DRAFT_1597379 [Panaeolus papilionaceus]
MVAVLSLVATLLFSAVAVRAQLPAGLPASCASGACKVLIDKFGNTSSATACASDVNCLCSAAVANSIRDCYKCAVDANAPGLDKKATDDGLAAYVDSCKAGGHPVDVSGGGSNTGAKDNSGNTGGARSLQMSQFAVVVALGGLALL